MKLVIRPDMTVDSRTISAGCGIKHGSAIRLLKKQLPSVEAELGLVRFKIQPSNARGKGGDGQKVAFLTEDQATALVTMFRNTPVVVRFKVALAKAFGQARRGMARNGNMSRADLARMVLAQEEAMESHRDVLTALMPVHAYGSLTDDGSPRLGVRRAAFVKQLHRISEAADIQRRCAQIELNLMLEDTK